MVANIKTRLSVQEYLAWEAENEIKHEYIDGEVYAMSGGTSKHSRVAANTTIAIGRQLGSSICAVHTSDMKVKVDETRYVYPDLSAVCGKEQFEDDSETTFLNPILVVEVTSPSSIERDRIAKRDFYREVPSIQAYLVIDQHRVCAELYTRADVRWLLQVYTDPDDVIPLEILNCELPLAEVYRGIRFEAAQPD
ncbi:MAG: Uma2 family endonuclease [Chloroflexota bacterium]|nr:Uma2 family endonuclease [Chloroflexota bacterium]